MGVEPGLGGEGDGGEQDLVLGLEPGQGLPVIGGLPGSGAGPGRREDDRLLGGFSRRAARAAVCR